MAKFKVIDPEGMLVDGKQPEEGDIIERDSSNGQVIAWLRFGQVEEVDRPAKKSSKKSEAEKTPEA